MDNSVEIYENNEEGYRKHYNDDNIRIAVLNYAERFDVISKLECYSETDETFVLLKGRATLL